MPAARLILTRDQLEAENRMLRRQLATARRALRTVLGGHHWEREIDTGVSCCSACGLRAYTPAAVIMTCADARSDRGRKKRGRVRSRPSG